LVLDIVTEAAVNDTDLRESRRLFTSAAQNLAKRVGSPKDLDSAMQLLRDFGFYPDRTTDTGKELIISYNCPFFSVAEKYPELSCETFHSTFLKNLLGAPKVTLEATMARGAPKCVHGVGFPHHVKRVPIRTRSL